MRRQEGRNPRTGWLIEHNRPRPAAATPGWCAAADTPAASAACAAKADRHGCCARGSGAGASQGTGRGGSSARRGIPGPHDAGHAAAAQCEGARGAAAVRTDDAADRGRLGNPARHRREAAIFAAARARAARAPARGVSALERGGLRSPASLSDAHGRRLRAAEARVSRARKDKPRHHPWGAGGRAALLATLLARRRPRLFARWSGVVSVLGSSVAGARQPCAVQVRPVVRRDAGN